MTKALVCCRDCHPQWEVLQSFDPPHPLEGPWNNSKQPQRRFQRTGGESFEAKQHGEPGFQGERGEAKKMERNTSATTMEGYRMCMNIYIYIIYIYTYGLLP